MTAVTGPLLTGAEIRVDGVALDPAVQAQVLEVRVDQHLRLPDRASIRLADPRLELADGTTFALGATFEVLITAPGDTSPVSLFDGQIGALEPEFSEREAILAVRAYDRSQTLHRTKRTDTYQEMSYGDIAQAVAQRNGLTAGTIEAGAGAVPFVQQSNETDWELLSRLADAVGFEVGVSARELHFRPASTSTDAGSPVELAWGETLVDFRPRVTGLRQVESVSVRAWDPSLRQEIVATAVPQAGGTSIGIARDDAASALGGGTLVIADQPVSSQAQADALATGLAARIADGFVEADGTTVGDPRLRAGGSIKVSGVGSRFGGTYVLSSATHVVRSNRGYETRFTVSPGPARPLGEATRSPFSSAWRHTIVVGLVTNNQDPDGLGRVRVSYPALGSDHEGWWARVVGAAAGGRRGLLMVPQAGDEVLLGFEHDDEERPIVIGSVWNGEGKPEELAHLDGSFALRSEKQVVVDAVEAISITADQKLTLTAAGDATLTTEPGGDGPPGNVDVTAKGNATMKAGTAVSVEAGTEAKVAANTALTVKAGTQLTLEGGAEVTIKAAMLNLKATGPVQISGAQVMLG
jgi:phage protein D